MITVCVLFFSLVWSLHCSWREDSDAAMKAKKRQNKYMKWLREWRSELRCGPAASVTPSKPKSVRTPRRLPDTSKKKIPATRMINKSNGFQQFLGIKLLFFWCFSFTHSHCPFGHCFICWYAVCLLLFHRRRCGKCAFMHRINSVFYFIIVSFFVILRHISTQHRRKISQETHIIICLPVWPTFISYADCEW